MTLDQSYFRSRLRLHNRMLHGWGVVCGARVCRVPAPADDKSNGQCDNGATDCDGYKPWKIIVKRGYILGPYGDDIVVGCDHEVDLRTIGVTGISGESTEDAEDPWCCATSTRQGDGCYWVAVKYKECKARPVRVQPVGCGCDDTRCEYSRWRDGYEIGIRDSCPEDQWTEPQLPHLSAFKGIADGCIPPCPPCPKEPWVVLAQVCVDENACIKSIDNCSCRRLVVSFAHYWWKCDEEAPKIIEVVVKMDGDSDNLMPGKTSTVIIRGTGFADDAQVSFARSGVRVREYVSRKKGTEIEVVVSVDEKVEAGACPFKVINPCGGESGKDNIDIGAAQPPTGPTLGRPPIDRGTRTTKPIRRKKKKTGATRKKSARRKKATRKRRTSRRPTRRKRKKT
ncbi:MAG: hypothetical protein V3T84_01350 [Phycisphaerales bacterium]